MTTEPVIWGPGAMTARPRAVATEARAPQSLCSTIREAASVKSPHSTAAEQSPLPKLEKSLNSNKDPEQPKNE